MPRRTIVLGRQPTSFNFQDDHGPLVNGLAYAASQWLASGRDRAQIEMQQEANAADDARQAQEHADSMALRQEDMELRRLALGQQDQYRQDMLQQQRDALRQTQVRDAANAAEAWRDDVGATVKFGFDNLIGRFLPKPGATGATSPATDLSRDKFYWERAVQEIGDPDSDVEIVETTDLYGNPVKREVRRPLTSEQRAERARLINERFDVLRGVRQPAAAPTTAPIPAPAPAPPAPTITQSALGAPAATPVVNADQQDRSQFLAGAGGWGTLAPSWIGPQNGAPSTPAPTPVPQAPQDPRAVFIQQSGVNPDPSTGIDVADFVGPDPVRRVQALRLLPPQDRLRAIQTLRAMGFN